MQAYVHARTQIWSIPKSSEVAYRYFNTVAGRYEKNVAFFVTDPPSVRTGALTTPAAHLIGQYETLLESRQNAREADAVATHPSLAIELRDASAAGIQNALAQVDVPNMTGSGNTNVFSAIFGLTGQSSDALLHQLRRHETVREQVQDMAYEATARARIMAAEAANNEWLGSAVRKPPSDRTDLLESSKTQREYAYQQGTYVIPPGFTPATIQQPCIRSDLPTLEDRFARESVSAVGLSYEQVVQQARFATASEENADMLAVLVQRWATHMETMVRDLYRHIYESEDRARVSEDTLVTPASTVAAADGESAREPLQVNVTVTTKQLGRKEDVKFVIEHGLVNAETGGRMIMRALNFPEQLMCKEAAQNLATYLGKRAREEQQGEEQGGGKRMRME